MGLYRYLFDDIIASFKMLELLKVTFRVEDSWDGDGMDAKVVEAPRSPPFLFEELIEDIQDLLLDRFLDLPTLLSLGYTSKAFLSRVDKALMKSRGGKARLRDLYADAARLGYFELFKFFVLEISPRIFPGLNTPAEMMSVISEAVAHGHVQFVQRLMATRDDHFVGFFFGNRMRLPVSSFTIHSVEWPLCQSNSPAMFDLLMEGKVQLDLKSLAKVCIRLHSVDLLKHILTALDVVTLFKLLIDVPREAISSGAIDILDFFINELKLIQVEGNAFLVTVEAHYYSVPFETAWLVRRLLEVSTYLDRLGVQRTYSPEIGFEILRDGDPNFLVYLEQKGIDYRDLLDMEAFDSVLTMFSMLPQFHENSICTFYNVVFRDRHILNKLTSDLTKSLIRFLAPMAYWHPGVGLPLVRWIYDESPWRHSLPHPLELFFDVPSSVRSEEMMRFCIDFPWTSQIDYLSFFGRLKSLYVSEQSSYVRIIAEFIELKRREKSDLRFSALLVRHLTDNSRLSLKTLHMILLLLPPLENDVQVNFLSEFLERKCGSATEHDSFVSIVEWMESHLGCDVAYTSKEVVQKILVASHPKILAILFDRGLPMISDAALLVLRNLKADIGTYVKSELVLEKLRVLKQRGADFPKSLLRDAFERDLASANDVPPKHIARIFDFLLDDCGSGSSVTPVLPPVRQDGPL